MSTTPSSLSALPTSAGAIWSNWAVSLFAFTVLYYDWILTLPDEITHLWRKPPARGVLPMLCFFILRYVALFGHIAIAVELFSLSVGAEVRVFIDYRNDERLNERAFNRREPSLVVTHICGN